jgi:SAM-dependent MidA family methyltransferase
MLMQMSNSSQPLSYPLATVIAEKIANTGPISFAEYMQLALYHPSLGYYNNGSQKFGEAGDFITAPEISPLFGQCIARRIIPTLSSLPNANILEFGAGTGQLAVDILQALSAADALPSYYYILELSAELKNRQREKIAAQIPQLQQQVIWLDRLPADFQGVVIANEVLDAMPIHRFCFQKDLFWEYYVDYEQGNFQDKLMPATPSLLGALSNMQTQLNLAANYHSEINLLLPAWLASLADCVTQGEVLIIDYGFPRTEYYHPDRCMGTLMCHYQHQAHSNPYLWIGAQDITAHVDFTHVIESATAVGFELVSYTTQAKFLLECGLMELASDQQASVSENWRTSQAIKKLVLPSEMGELFKVMVLTKQ